MRMNYTQYTLNITVLIQTSIIIYIIIAVVTIIYGRSNAHIEYHYDKWRVFEMHYM